MQTLSRKLVDKQVLSFDSHVRPGESYIRSQQIEVLRGVTAQVKFHAFKHTFLASEYRLTVDGVVRAKVNPAPGTQTAIFTLPLTDISEGWHVLDIEHDGDETCAFIPAYVLKGAVAQPQEFMPVFTDSYENRIISTNSYHRLHWVPSKCDPAPNPLPLRDYPEFSTAVPMSQCWFESITGSLHATVRRPAITKEGILCTHQQMWYKWSDFTREKPNFPLLDGPRGVGNIGAATHIRVGDARFENDKPGSPLTHNLYVTDPWRLCRVTRDGTVTTLAGYRSPAIPSYWQEQPGNYELLGDWSAVPENERGFWELWGVAVDPESTRTDHAHPPIPSENNQVPHLVGPRFIVSDTQRNRLCSIRFNPKQHNLPPKIEVFARGQDLWDVVSWRDKIIASERGADRIVEYDLQGNVTRYVLEGQQGLAVVKKDRMVKRLASIDAIRSQDVCHPEGLFVVDDWLYFASIAAAEVRRVHLIDGLIELVWRVSETPKNSKQMYYKIAVSDGTAGPKGTVFLTRWIVQGYGGPHAHLPDGNQWRVSPYNNAQMPRGRGNGGFSSLGYNAAVAAKYGRIVWGSVQEGLRQVSLAQPGDPYYDRKKFKAGMKKWREKGYHLTHDLMAQSLYGLPLPWGVDSDIDYYLTVLTK